MRKRYAKVGEYRVVVWFEGPMYRFQVRRLDVDFVADASCWTSEAEGGIWPRIGLHITYCGFVDHFLVARFAEALGVAHRLATELHMAGIR